MKTSAFIIVMALMLTACERKQTAKDEVRFPPPVVKADVEGYEPPTEKQLESADPGQKELKGDPNASVRIAAPTNNYDVVEKSKDKLPVSSAVRVTDTTKKIVKEGDISFEAENISATRKRILQALKRQGGYVYDDSESLNSEDNHKEYSLKIRVPAKGFDMFLDSVLSGAKQIDTKNIRIKDVTTQFIDINTRLDHKKLLEARYLQLLKQASKMSDILEVENKLNEIRTDIESTQGQLNYLSKQVAYSSLDITFYSKAKTDDKTGSGFVYRFKRATDRGWKFVQSLFFDAIACWPAFVIGLILLIWYRRRKANKEVININ